MIRELDCYAHKARTMKAEVKCQPSHKRAHPNRSALVSKYRVTVSLFFCGIDHFDKFPANLRCV